MLKGTGSAASQTPLEIPRASPASTGVAATEQPNTKMRKHTKYVGALAAASALVAGYASAEIEGEVHVGYSNIYEFRFVDLGSDLIEAGADVSYDTGVVGLSAGAWYGSVNDSQTIGGNFNELDLYAAVSKDLGPVSLELGYIYYYFSDTPGTLDTQEVYLSASYDVAWGITASATYYYDFDSANGWYLQPEIGKTFEFNDCLALNLSAGVGIADGHGLQARSARLNPGSTADGFQGVFVKAELPWEFREGVVLAPYLKYTDADSKLAADINTLQGGQDHLIAGVKLSVGF
jgi:hypothetical protein